MIRVNTDKRDEFLKHLNEEYESQSCSPLHFANWINKAFPIIKGREYSKQEKGYPEAYGKGSVIRLAKTDREMLQILDDNNVTFEEFRDKYKGDELVNKNQEFIKSLLEPKEIFTIEKDMTLEDGTPIWFGNTMDGIPIRLGYFNGDVRKPDKYTLGAEDVHSTVGGATGAGKSVLLNQIICAMILELPPWELELTLADFKFTEMVRYSNVVPTPQVKTVVACEDVDYVISVLQNYLNEMKDRQKLFKKCDVADLAKFRKKFNLHMPQKLLLVDEFQQMFLQNAKKNVQIEKIITQITKLGRALGCHLLFASQSMQGTLSKDNLANFKLGVALYCDSSISEMLIKNDEASNLRGKGKCIANNTGKKKDNKLFRVPLVQETAITDYLIYLNELYEEIYKKRASTHSYDEELVRKQVQLNKDLSTYNLRSMFILGDTVRYKEGKGENLEFSFLKNGNDSDNFIIVSRDAQDLYYSYRLFLLNEREQNNRYGNVGSILIDASDYPNQMEHEYFEGRVFTSKKAEDLEDIYSLLERRKAFVRFDAERGDMDIEEYYDKLKIEDPENEEYYENMKIARLSNPKKEALKSTDFACMNIYIYNANAIQFLGRSTNTKVVGPFKEFLYDCTSYNIRTFLFLNEIGELRDIVGNFNHRLIYNTVAAKDLTVLQYEDTINEKLVAYQHRLNKAYKFKKYLLEIPSIVKEDRVELEEEVSIE